MDAHKRFLAVWPRGRHEALVGKRVGDRFAERLLVFDRRARACRAARRAAARRGAASGSRTFEAAHGQIEEERRAAALA